MKKIVIPFLFLSIFTISAQEKVNWLSFEKAIELNKTTPKPILIAIYADWCGWCKRMDRETYTDQQIVKYINENYHAVKFNGEGKKPITYKNYTFKFGMQGNLKYHELGALFMNGQLAYPTTVFLNKDEKLLDRIQGYLNPKKMEMALAYYIKKDRKTKDWGSFSENFDDKFKK